MIHRRWWWLLAVPLALITAAAVVRFTFLRRDFRSELGDDLFAPVQIAQAQVDSWSRSQIARARSAAGLLAAEAARNPSVTPSVSSFQQVAWATLTIDSSAVWLVHPDGRVLAAVGDRGLSPPSTVSGEHSFEIATPRCGSGFCAEIRAPIENRGVNAGILVLRAPITDTIFDRLHSIRRTRRGRTSLLVRDGDSVHVLATTSRDSTSLHQRAFSWRTAPAHVRSAFTPRTTTGTADTGLVYERVLYATAAIPGRDWVLLREMDAEELVGKMLAPLAAEVAFVASLFLLAFAWLRTRLRVARTQRERELAEVRADFIAAVSHELRTPLSQIRMFAELLRAGTIRKPQEVERSLNVIEKEASRLSILVDNLLNHARLRRRGGREHTRVAPTVTDVQRDIQYVIESFAPLAAEKDMRIQSSVSGTLPAMVDSQTLRQILLNLLENAARYGPRAQTVTISAAEHAGRVRISVADEGPGVSESERETIWSPFQRGSAATTSGAGGAGIGLSVVRDLVAQHDGSTWVEAATGGGARFVVEFARGTELGVGSTDSSESAIAVG